jgi:Rrf2 family protein
MLGVIAISKQTDYAARIILHLAMQPPGTRTTAQEIARRRLIPSVFVRRIITQLAKGGLLVTTRGSGGGIALAHPSSQISLLDVVELMEGPLALNACTINPQECPLMAICSVHETWVKARDLLMDYLRSATFDKLARRGLDLE